MLYQCRLVVGHILGCRGELSVCLDDLVNSIQEILLCSHLPPCPDGVHTSFRAHRTDLRTWDKTTSLNYILDLFNCPIDLTVLLVNVINNSGEAPE